MAQTALETISTHRCFGGTVGFYKHASTVNNCTMRFAVFVPPQAQIVEQSVLVLGEGLEDGRADLGIHGATSSASRW